MAAQHAHDEHETDYTIGSMPMEEQSSTYDAFVGFTKWGSLAIAAIVVLFTLMFCTPAGFIGSVAATVVLVALGVFFLRAKKADEPH